MFRIREHLHVRVHVQVVAVGGGIQSVISPRLDYIISVHHIPIPRGWRQCPGYQRRMKEVIAPQTHFLIFKLFHWTFVPLSLSGFDEHPSVQKLSDGSYHRYNRYCCHLRFFRLYHLSDVDIPLLPHSDTSSPTNAVSSASFFLSSSILKGRSVLRTLWQC